MMIRLMLNRRSIRKYKKQSIEREKLDKILTAGLLAPSSRDRKPWEFIMVDDPGHLLELSQAKAHGAAFIEDAPVAVVVIADAEKSDACIEDMAIAITYMQLEAESLDLGSCWVQIRMRETEDGKTSEGYIKTLLHIPERYIVEAVIAFGYKGEEKEPHNLKDLEGSKIHFHEFGTNYQGKFG